MVMPKRIRLGVRLPPRVVYSMHGGRRYKQVGNRLYVQNGNGLWSFVKNLGRTALRVGRAIAKNPIVKTATGVLRTAADSGAFGEPAQIVSGAARALGYGRKRMVRKVAVRKPVAVRVRKLRGLGAPARKPRPAPRTLAMQRGHGTVSYSTKTTNISY